MEPIETIDYKGYKIDIMPDDLPESPRDWENLGKMICFHSRYNLGDEHTYKAPDDFIYDLAIEFFNEDKVDDEYQWGLSSKEFIDKYLPKLEKYIFILPLYLYDHSGLTMNTSPFSCPWDSGQVGWIYVKKEDVRKEWKVKQISPKLKEKSIDNLKVEVEVYDQFLRGDIFGRIIYHDGEDVGSCWGFYGDPEAYMIPDAKAEVDALIKESSN